MEHLNKMNLVKLSENKMRNISGGLMPWSRLVEGGRRLLELAGAYEAGKDIVEGYKACRE